MSAVRITLETVTLLFAGGADPRGEPELRAASVRGVLRFWWRALVAGVIGDKNLETLRQEEAAVFGDTEQGSPVVVRLSGHTHPQPFLPNQNQRGMNYLLWSMLRTNRQCLPFRAQFTLNVQTRPGASNGGEAFKGALASLWLLAHLGGLGSRSRRGGGSVQVTGALTDIPTGMPDLRVQAQTPQQLCTELANGLQQLRTLVSARTATPTLPSANPEFDVLHPSCCRIVVLSKQWSTWDQALDEVGQKFQTFRSRRPPDYQNVKDVLSGNTNNLSPVHRAAFGLPIVFYYRSLSGQQGTLEGRTYERRASPLLIRVIRLTNGAHTVVMTVFKAALLEHKGQLTLKQRGHAPVTAAPPDLRLLDTFLNNIGQSIPLLEVKW